VFFIAEVGGNHEGAEGTLRELHRLALTSGADAVKYQLYRGDTLVSRVEGTDRNAHFKRFELPLEVYGDLADMCRDAGVDFMASTWDLEWIEWADARSRMHKVGSGDLTAFPLIRRLVQTECSAAWRFRSEPRVHFA
jgi:sialic acid synthase SpsE